MQQTEKIAMQVEYLGTHSHGWQKQPTVRTLQNELEKVLSKIADHEIQTICAGRTDTGVHAIGQVVHFETTAHREERSWLLGTNTLLPNDISVSWCRKISNDFDARYSALARSYRYYILNALSRSALSTDRAYWNYHSLDSVAMHSAAQYFLGEQDFTSVRGADCQSNTPFRNVQHIQVTRKNHWIIIDIKANAFLHHMVRNIVGCLLEVGLNKQPIDWIQTVLEAKDRKQAGITAPAHGLYFIQAHYPEKYNLPEVSCSPVLPY